MWDCFSSFVLYFQVFAEWNKGALDSYLIEITSHILQFKDEKRQTLLPNIRDTAGQVRIHLDVKSLIISLKIFHSCIKISINGNIYEDEFFTQAFQKGTGKWTGIAALNYGVPLTLIGKFFLWQIFYKMSSKTGAHVMCSPICISFHSDGRY